MASRDSGRTPAAERGALRRVFGARLRELRQRRGLTQRDLGKLARMHPAYVGGLERGERNVTLDVLERLAEALGIPAAHLLVRPGLHAAGVEARVAELVAGARAPEHLALALDVASLVLERLAASSPAAQPTVRRRWVAAERGPGPGPGPGGGEGGP